MRWSLLWPVLYLLACLGACLQAIGSSGPPSERWLLAQGLTLPWGVACSYLPGFAEWPELCYLAIYGGASLLNAALLRWLLQTLGRLANLPDPADPDPADPDPAASKDSLGPRS
ncbi:MAG: hypothetical protein ACKOJF_03900 [Planctomycetaceae bacterium]